MERKSISSKEFVKGKIYTPWMLDSRQVKYEMDFGGSEDNITDEGDLELTMDDLRED